MQKDYQYLFEEICSDSIQACALLSSLFDKKSYSSYFLFLKDYIINATDYDVVLYELYRMSSQYGKITSTTPNFSEDYKKVLEDFIRNISRLKSMNINGDSLFLKNYAIANIHTRLVVHGKEEGCDVQDLADWLRSEFNIDHLYANNHINESVYEIVLDNKEYFQIAYDANLKNHYDYSRDMLFTVLEKKGQYPEEVVTLSKKLASKLSKKEKVSFLDRSRYAGNETSLDFLYSEISSHMSIKDKIELSYKGMSEEDLIKIITYTIDNGQLIHIAMYYKYNNFTDRVFHFMLKRIIKYRGYFDSLCLIRVKLLTWDNIHPDTVNSYKLELEKEYKKLHHNTRKKYKRDVEDNFLACDEAMRNSKFSATYILNKLQT